MKPALFDLERPHSIEEALAMLADKESESRALAGGQSLVPLMNFRLSRPERLVSLNHLPELTHIDTDGDDLVIGAMVRQRTAEQSPLAGEWCPLLRETLEHVAHPPIRNRGTIGGSIAHADPSAELPALAVLLRARLVLRGLSGQRTVDARDFFLGPYETTIVPGELLTGIRLPRTRLHQGHAVVEVSRRAGDFALAGAMAVVEIVGGLVTSADLTLFGVGGRPIVSEAAGQLVGREPTAALIGEAAQTAASAIRPVGDEQASPRFRAHLTGVVARRALAQAVSRASAGDER